jgi:hypothetical protein
MLNSFIIVLREGFESLLLVAVILSYLKKSGHRWLTTAVYVAIVAGLSASAGLGYLLRVGVEVIAPPIPLRLPVPPSFCPAARAGAIRQKHLSL